MKKFRQLIRSSIAILIEFASLPILYLLAWISRNRDKQFHVGLGPTPIINNLYHKKALETAGYNAETFVIKPYRQTDKFDFDASKKFRSILMQSLFLYTRSLFRYQCLYIFFDGGPLASTRILWRFEPFLLRTANIKVVVSGYGSDVIDFSIAGSPFYKHATCMQYPKSHLRHNLVKKRVGLWTRYASHVIGSGDLVDYLYHWDTLTSSHLAIDTSALKNVKSNSLPLRNRPLRILHAPNHRLIKGTQFLIQAVAELQTEGFSIELVILEGQPNDIVLQEVGKADLVVDQLVCGWYGLFAVEAMAQGKPVLCYLRSDLLELYHLTGIKSKEEIPLINCNPDTLKVQLKRFLNDSDLLIQVGEKSKKYVQKYHSLEAVGKFFKSINESLSIKGIHFESENGVALRKLFP